MSRVLGIDHGTQRVGFALSDRLGITAQPHSVVPLKKAVAEIVRLASAEEVELIVIGLPVTLSGREGVRAKEARTFGTEVANATGLPVVFWDERLTTKTAESAMLSDGVKRHRRRMTVDKIAAAIMLQSYLDSR